ncbi:hypothetical protein MASR2M29_16740 [Spirochaetota bacterium]
MNNKFTFVKAPDDRLSSCLVCMVCADIDKPEKSPPELEKMLMALVQRRAAKLFPPAELKEAVRAMLRAGGFKPAGRQKPASEYLAQAAREGRFPLINGPVDCNNLLSLESGLPISLLDSSGLHAGVVLRICTEGESYVFNQSGQEMDLNGLLCICNAEGRPLGNPVKDSMAAKLTESSKEAAGFIFAPRAIHNADSLRLLGERFAMLLESYCGARNSRVEAVI